MIYKRPDSIEVPIEVYVARYGSEEHAKQRLYNIGAGAWSHPCWTNVDLPAQTEAFAKIQAPCIHHDLTKESPLPLSDGSVDAIYCSHVVEHIPESAVLTFMKESYRCLDDAGVLRIVTGPCADLDWDALMRRDEDWWFWFKDADFQEAIEKHLPPPTVHDYWLYSVATPRSDYSSTDCEKKFRTAELIELVAEHKDHPGQLLDMLTQSLPFDSRAPGDHISWWNYDKLHAFLRKAGFTHIHRSGYGQSTSVLMRDLRYFDQTYPQISIYVEAHK